MRLNPDRPATKPCMSQPLSICTPMPSLTLLSHCDSFFPSPVASPPSLTPPHPYLFHPLHPASLFPPANPFPLPDSFPFPQPPSSHHSPFLPPPSSIFSFPPTPSPYTSPSPSPLPPTPLLSFPLWAFPLVSAVGGEIWHEGPSPFPSPLSQQTLVSFSLSPLPSPRGSSQPFTLLTSQPPQFNLPTPQAP
ncbi:unnamed protein product [Closterium sp. NIES-53]